MKQKAASVRDKELRLALICYGGISLAVYMHGVTKEIWHATRASARVDAETPSVKGYRALLDHIAAKAQIGIRVIPDIIAGARNRGPRLWHAARAGHRDRANAGTTYPALARQCRCRSIA